MATNKHAQIRYNTLDKCFRNPGRQYTLEDLLEACNQAIDGEERWSLEDFIKEYDKQPLGKFIRSILGLEMTAEQQAFANFLQSGNLRTDQMTFINNIIKYLTKNGSIDKSLLFEPPITDVNDQGLMGVFEDADANKIISIIDTINENTTKVS